MSSIPIAGFTLGTAQLGMAYGIANTTGMPPSGQATALVKRAAKRGVRSIDTARAYGASEARIGRALASIRDNEVRIITKLDPLSQLTPEDSVDNVLRATDESVFRSQAALARRPLNTLLIHRWAHRTAFGGLIWHRLEELKRDGQIEVLGASVYTPEEAAEALNDPTVGHVQLPFNILDWRWKLAGIDEMALRRTDVVIHARSALLQGLIASDSSIWARMQYDGSQILSNFDRLAKDFGREDRVDLSFAYVRAQSWINSVVVGVDTNAQLDVNLRFFSNPPLSSEQCVEAERLLAGSPAGLLNPSLWKVK